MAALCSSLASTTVMFVVLVTGPAFSSVVVAADALEPSPSEVTAAPTPEGDEGPISGQSPGSEADPTPPDTSAVPEPELQRPDGIEAEATEPEAAAPTEGEEMPVAEPLVTEPPADDAAIDPSLLDAEARDPLAPVATAPVGRVTEPSGRSPEERDAAIEAAYANLYRPADNPIRLNVTGRAMFANISGRERVNGRLGGASIDIKPS